MAYSEERRESLVRRMLSGESRSELARESGVAEPTLYRLAAQAQ